MSHVPTQRYGYAQATTPLNYYYDDTEGSYGGDYSESEALSDTQQMIPRQTPDVTELYRRKVIAVAPRPATADPYNMHRGIYYAPEYYYEPMSAVVHAAPPQTRRTFVPTGSYRRRVSVRDDGVGHYYTPEMIEDAYARMAYRSSPHLASSTRTSPPRVPSATLTQPVRKHAVTVRTPRYYRRTATGVLKKPSALCLPTSCQPDPATHRRARKAAVDQHAAAVQQSHQHAAVQENKRLASPQAERRMDSRGDVGGSRLDSVFERYEKILSDASRATSKKAAEIATKNAAVLKPRVPASVKAKQEKTTKTKTVKTSKETSKETAKEAVKQATTSGANNLEVEEITTEVLDNLLSELMSKNDANELRTEEVKARTFATEVNKFTSTETEKKEEPKEENKRKHLETSSVTSESTKHPEPHNSKSFNYQDISQHMLKPQNQPERKLESRETREAENRSVGGALSPRLSQHSKVGLDPTAAMELHKSKSYIVSLIDRALSKELGTSPEAKFARPQYEYPSIDGKGAIESMQRQSGKRPDQDLCIEITQALTESFISNATAPSHSGENKTEISCPYAAGGEEPVYLKQLKQLRWGHLRHIQREVRRLEDLERFLDSCSSQHNF